MAFIHSFILQTEHPLLDQHCVQNSGCKWSRQMLFLLELVAREDLSGDVLLKLTDEKPALSASGESSPGQEKSLY